MAAHNPAKTSSRRHIGSRVGPTLLATVVAFAAGLATASLSLADDPTVEASGGPYGYYWCPANASVAPGGSVAFRNSSASVMHGLSWKDGPEAPSCSGVPVDEGKTNWTGACAFAQAGTYSFFCPVHPTEMEGTITVSAGGSLGGDPPPTSGQPPTGPVANELKLARRQRGGAVRGSLQLLRTGFGSRLVVELTAPRARLLGPSRAGKLRVGRLVRSSPPQGRLRFAVSLGHLARGALLDGKALPLTVKITMTSPEGGTFERTRGVVVR